MFHFLFSFLDIILNLSKKISAKRPIDLIGLCLNIIVQYCSVFPLFLVTFLFHLGTDPITLFYSNICAKFVTTPNFFMYITSRVISCILFSVAILEASRFMSSAIVINTVGGYLIVDCILNLDKIFTRRKSDRYDGILLQYEILQIILQATYEVTSSAIILCMTSAFVCGICCNFVTLKLYDKLPMTIYLTLLTTSVFLQLTTKLMLTLIIDVYEKGKVLRGKWLLELGKVNNIKYFKRKLASERAVALYGGLVGFNVYKLDKGVKPTYYFEIASYTITLCLSVPLVD